jgi:hypothetical protein
MFKEGATKFCYGLWVGTLNEFEQCLNTAIDIAFGQHARQFFPKIEEFSKDPELGNRIPLFR